MAIALDRARSAKEKAIVLEISIIFYAQQLQEQKAVPLGLQALQVGSCLKSCLFLFGELEIFNCSHKTQLLGVELERKESFIDILNIDLTVLPEMKNKGKFAFSHPFSSLTKMHIVVLCTVNGRINGSKRSFSKFVLQIAK